MEKLVIGIIDSEMNNLHVVDRLKQDLTFDKLYYYNVFLGEYYEEHSNKSMEERISDALKFLDKKGVNMLLFMGNEALEYYEKKMEEIKINHIVFPNSIIDLVNRDFPEENICLFAKDNVVRANIYQRNINYQHLYPLLTDRLEKAALKGEIKTDLSFALVKEELKSLAHKSFDLIVYTSINSSLFNTELSQYLKGIKLIDIYSCLMKEIKDHIATISFRKSGNRDIYIVNSDINPEFISDVVTCKYKLVTLRKQNE